MNIHSQNPPERRRHTRTPIGLPVRVHFSGQTLAVTIELSDISMTGCYFSGASAPTEATLAFGFVLPHRELCLARARVVRVDRSGFAARLERVNGAFAEFVSSLSQAIPASAA
jgi:PilZ domain